MRGINFKDIIKKGGQDQHQYASTTNANAWSKQNVLNKVKSQKNLYKEITSQLSSQQFEMGELRRNQYQSQVPRKKNSTILQMQCESDPIQIHYGSTNQQIVNQKSMINSNTHENFNGSLFESKLHQTKGELSEQILDLEKRMKKEIQRDRTLIQDYLNRLFNKYTEKSKDEQRKNFDIIVSQLNKNLSVTSKKQKQNQSAIIQQSDKLVNIQKQLHQFINETEEKIERVMNNAIQVGSSMKKSFSRNIGNNGDYVMELKNSIKQIPVVGMNGGFFDEIKSEIHQIQQTIKNMKFQLMYIKQDIKTKSFQTNQLPKPKSQAQVDLHPKVANIESDLSYMKAKLKEIERMHDEQKQKNKQFHSILEIQEENYVGINQTFQKVINNSIVPKIKKLQDHMANQSLEKNIQIIKRVALKQLQSMPIIRVKSLTDDQKEKLEKMRLQDKKSSAYMLDQKNYILDCFGNYLIDENNQRIRLEEDQIYYLEHMQGIQIKVAIDTK